MSNRSLTILLLSALLGLAACKSSQTAAMDSPEATFATLTRAIADRDLDLYTACWHPDRKEKEGMVSKLAAQPDTWDELAGLFKGAVSIGEKSFGERDGHRTCRLNIEAPEADGGGIGGMTMMEVDGKWLMWTW